MPFAPKLLTVLAVAGVMCFGEDARTAEQRPQSPRADDVSSAPKTIVSTVCARCHDVESPGGWSPRPDAPGFAQVAREHPEYVEGVMLRPPRAMWGVDIEDTDHAEIRAYFAHLRALQSASPEDRGESRRDGGR